MTGVIFVLHFMPFPDRLDNISFGLGNLPSSIVNVMIA